MACRIFTKWEGASLAVQWGFLGIGNETRGGAERLAEARKRF
jgi:hypothetical protein